MKPSEQKGFATGLRYPVEALVRDDAPAARALQATRALVRLVAELDEDSFAALDIHTGSEPGRLEIALELHGEAMHEVTARDLAAAVGAAVVIGAPVGCRRIAPAHIATAYELARIEVGPMFRRIGAEDFGRPEWATDADLADGPAFAVPLPNEADAVESLLVAMAGCLAADDGAQVWVRTVLMAADELSTRIAVDDLNASLRRQDVAAYARVPVLARTVVTSSGRVPVAVRVALRERGCGLRLVPVARDEARSLWTDPASALRSVAVGETHAVALARVPAAGTVPALGVATRRPPVADRPLDPMPPQPGCPIRLGWATDAFGQRVDAELDIADLVRHCFVEGQTGSGKTTAITQIFWSVTRAGHQVVYLDPHGDGAARAAAYSTALDDATTLYVRHGDLAHPVRINPLRESDVEMRERAASDLMDLIQNMLDPQQQGMVGERFKRTFTLVAQATVAVLGPAASITDVLALALTKDALRALAKAVRPRSADLAARLEAELVSLGDKEFAELISWFVSRLQPLLRTPALREIVGTGEDAIDLLDVLDSGTNLIVDLASLELGEDVSRVLGALWLLKIRSAMGRRADRSRPVVLLVDEAHLYTFGALPGLLAEARKFGIGVVVATQAPDNLSPRLQRAIEANCGSAVSLRTGINAAGAASSRLGGWPPTQLTRLADLTAAASLSRAGVPTEAFTLHVDHWEVAAAHGWSASSLDPAAQKAAERSLDLVWAPLAKLAVRDDTEVLALMKRAASLPSRMRARTDEGIQAPRSSDASSPVDRPTTVRSKTWPGTDPEAQSEDPGKQHTDPSDDEVMSLISSWRSAQAHPARPARADGRDSGS